MPTRVLVDANVFFSRTLRDWLAFLYLESDSFFGVYWTEDIIAETIYRLRRKHPEWSGSRTTLVHDRIRATFEGGRVEDFAPDGSFHGSDSDDAHIHDAAVACGAHILLTGDAGFSEGGSDEATTPYDVYKPDDFFVLIDDSAPAVVRSAVVKQRDYWLRRAGAASLPQHLKKAGCPRFADRVRAHLQTLPIR